MKKDLNRYLLKNYFIQPMTEDTVFIGEIGKDVGRAMSESDFEVYLQKMIEGTL